MKAIRKDKALFNIFSYALISILSVVCILPFIIIISSSLTSEAWIMSNGYPIIPKNVTLQAYTTVFQNPIDVLRAYGVTIYTTGIGTILSLLFTSMTAYVLSRKDFEWRNKFSFFFYFTTLFGGGLVPWYILCVQYLKFKQNPLMALIIPGLFSVFNILVVKNFMNSIPDAIVESAKIDGAGDFLIYRRLILPLSKPAIATVGLFIALNYWNDWFSSFMFINNSKYYSLQFYLYKMISSIDALNRVASLTGRSVADMPKESIKMAMTVIATGPIIALYPFLQKYFVKGLTIGAVKG